MAVKASSVARGMKDERVRRSVGIAITIADVHSAVNLDSDNTRASGEQYIVSQMPKVERAFQQAVNSIKEQR